MSWLVSVKCVYSTFCDVRLTLRVFVGEGRFGKVYECRNLDNGEMNAVKQV